MNHLPKDPEIIVVEQLGLHFYHCSLVKHELLYLIKVDSDFGSFFIEEFGDAFLLSHNTACVGEPKQLI